MHGDGSTKTLIRQDIRETVTSRGETVMDDATKANDQAEQEHAHESLQQLVAYRLSRVQAKMNAQATRILRIL